MRDLLLACASSLLVSLFGTPLFIRFLVSRGYGQFIRDDGPTSHHTKRGTPTMGGLIIIAAVVIGYATAHLIEWSEPTATGLLLIGLMSGMGLVGFVDDYLKIAKQRSLGLRAGPKLIGQTIVAVGFALAALLYDPDIKPIASTAVSFIRDTNIDFKMLGTIAGIILFCVWALVMIAGASNGVNLTDGLDGLATGATCAVGGAYILIALWQSNKSCWTEPVTNCYPTRDPLDAAVVAAALVGATMGFLWWNASPAKIFMGDTGSLALGGVLAGLAIVTRTELLLVILGGLFVIIAVSVIIQVGFFKLTGHRVFRMAPLQHHFELAGWNEVTIVIRFWIIGLLCTGLGVGIFYAEANLMGLTQ